MKPQHAIYIMTGCIVLMTLCYLAYLANCWNAYQNDRLAREEKINELLARFPRKPADTSSDTKPNPE